MIQHRPSRQYATLDVYNPFETREVSYWRAQEFKEGEGLPVRQVSLGTGDFSACTGRKKNCDLSSLREASQPWDVSSF